MPVRLGLAFVPSLPPERLPALAATVEEAGLDELWVWEDCFKQSGIASAAVALQATATLTVGIGLLPVPLRNVALTAMEIATLARIHPGRLIAGIGHGVQVWMGQVGVRPASPLTLLEEYAVTLRRLLHGDRVTVSGRYVTLDDVALDWPPDPPPPLMLGGAGPRSVALAARLGDGTLLTGSMTDAEVESTCELIRQTRGEDRRANHPVVNSQIVSIGPGAAERVSTELTRWGKAADAPIGLSGDAQSIADGVRRWARSGVTSFVVQPCADEPDLDGLIRFLGREVKPLVTAETSAG